MNVFEYFRDEEQSIEQSLTELTLNYEVWTREQVFDRVKLICDNLMGHLKKHDALLLAKLEGSSQLENLLADYKKDRAIVEEEIGQLVEVHVDEPEYDECLEKLLKVVEAHIAFSRRLYAGIQQFASQQELDLLNKQFNEVVLHSTDFNYLQEAS